MNNKLGQITLEAIENAPVELCRGLTCSAIGRLILSYYFLLTVPFMVILLLLIRKFEGIKKMFITLLFFLFYFPRCSDYI